MKLQFNERSFIYTYKKIPSTYFQICFVYRTSITFFNFHWTLKVSKGTRFVYSSNDDKLIFTIPQSLTKGQ